MNKAYLAPLIALTMVLAGCAQHYTPEASADPYGFFSGIWHGIIFPFSLIGYFIFKDVFIIGEPNTGLWYYVGFVLGILSLGGSGAR